MLKLKLQYFGHLTRTDNSLEKSLKGKNLSLIGKDWGQKKSASENEMAGQHHWCNEHELGQTPDRGRRRPGVLQSMCGKESDMTRLLNNNNNKVKVLLQRKIGNVPPRTFHEDFFRSKTIFRKLVPEIKTHGFFKVYKKNWDCPYSTTERNFSMTAVLWT